MLLNFDRYQRYKICSDLINAIKACKEAFSILEVGSGGLQELALFLPEDKITFFDRSFPPNLAKRPEFVTGNAINLPFAAGSFDLVVSIDVYEHIPAQDRPVYLEELLRCARRQILLAAPFANGLVLVYEKLCYAYYKTLHSQEHPWLQEHLENGLPDLPATIEFFTQRNWMVEVIPNGFLPHWLIMQVPYFLLLKNPSLKDLFVQLNAFYNQFCYPADNREPAYRKILIICKDHRDLGPVLEAKRQILSACSREPAIGNEEATLNYLVDSFWRLYLLLR